MKLFLMGGAVVSLFESMRSSHSSLKFHSITFEQYCSFGPISRHTTLNHMAVHILNASPSNGWLAGPFPSLARFVSFGVVFQGLIRCHSIKSTFGLGESVAMAALWKVESPMVLTQSALIKTAHSAWRGTVPHCTAQPEKFHTKSMTATDASQMKLKRICIAKEGKKEMEESQRTPPDLKLALRQARINTALLICRRLVLPWWHRSGKAQ